jgi:tetratricopeptide (TPR) repeat protein
MRLRRSFATVLMMILPFFSNGQNSAGQLIDATREIKSKFYEVTETIHSTFGSTKVIYTVSNKNMINTYDLGPNNTREVKEVIIYKKKKSKSNIASNTNNIEAQKEVPVVEKEKDTIRTIMIYPLETYERMVEKGIKSIEILTLLGDSYFYKNNFLKAANYYEALFKLTNDLKQEYYLRYSQSLISSGQIAKAKEFNKKYKVLLSKQ